MTTGKHLVNRAKVPVVRGRDFNICGIVATHWWKNQASECQGVSILTPVVSFKEYFPSSKFDRLHRPDSVSFMLRTNGDLW